MKLASSSSTLRLVFDFMSTGKRTAMAREMVASSNVAYRTYVTTVLRVASDARKAWIELAFIDESIRLRESSVGALEQSLEIANTDYTTGRGMGTLANQVRVTNDIAKVRTELATLADRRAAVRTRFKSALGLVRTDRDPAWPQASLAPTALPSEDELWPRTAIRLERVDALRGREIAALNRRRTAADEKAAATLNH